MVAIVLLASLTSSTARADERFALGIGASAVHLSPHASSDTRFPEALILHAAAHVRVARPFELSFWAGIGDPASVMLPMFLEARWHVRPQNVWDPVVLGGVGRVFVAGGDVESTRTGLRVGGGIERRHGAFGLSFTVSHTWVPEDLGPGGDTPNPWVQFPFRWFSATLELAFHF